MPNPSDYNNQGAFVSACVNQRQDEHPDESVEQSRATCISMWSNKMSYTAQEQIRVRLRTRRLLGQVRKDDSQARQDFMDECVDALAGIDDDAENTCSTLWEEQGSEGE